MIRVVNRPIYGRFAGVLISKPIAPVVEFFPMPFNLPNTSNDDTVVRVGVRHCAVLTCLRVTEATARTALPKPCLTDDVRDRSGRNLY
jgi:hypothetical protein